MQLQEKKIFCMGRNPPSAAGFSEKQGIKKWER